VNVIAKKASCLLEIRAVNQRHLDDLKAKLQKLIKKISSEYKEIRILLKVLAETKAASFPKNHRLYRLTRQVQNYLGIRSFFEAGNNDGDISLAQGIPTVTLGSRLGFKTHSQEEYLEKKSLLTGIKQDFLVLLNILNNF